MKITLLCNAGIMLEYDQSILLIDLPNREVPPFGALPDETWNQILNRAAPYDRVCGFWFSHVHPDHCDLAKVQAYREKWPEVPVFAPEKKHIRGKGKIGPFVIAYQRMEHAPIPDAPHHVVTWIEAGDKSVYLPADAALNCDMHRDFIKNRKANAAIWNSMYLSREDTRALMKESAEKSYIYHMPPQRPDGSGLWKKLERNMERYPKELSEVTVWDTYPTTIEL